MYSEGTRNISLNKERRRCDEYIAGEKHKIFHIFYLSISIFFCLNFFSKKYRWNKNSLFSVLQQHTYDCVLLDSEQKKIIYSLSFCLPSYLSHSLSLFNGTGKRIISFR